MSLVFWLAIGFGCIVLILFGAFLEWYEHKDYYRTVKAKKRRLKEEEK